MGESKGPYNAEFPSGSLVQILEREHLEAFRRSWTYHHPLAEEQLDWGGHRAKVTRCSFYHGGGELYELEGVPGIWHEACLKAARSE